MQQLWPVVPQRGRVLRAVDGQVVQDLAVARHVPVHAQDVLRSGVAVPGEVGVGVDEELRHVPVPLHPERSGHLNVCRVEDGVHEGSPSEEVVLEVVVDVAPPGQPGDTTDVKSEL